MRLRIFNSFLVQKAAIFVLIGITLSCQRTTSDLPIVFPADTWEEKKPEILDIDSQKLEEALGYLTSKAGKNSLNQVVVVRKGYVVFQGDSIHKKQDIGPAGQVFTSAVFGLLSDYDIVFEEGYVRKIDTAFAPYYPDLKLKHFASMTSGYSEKTSAMTLTPSSGKFSTPYVINGPLFAPGTEFKYSKEAQMVFGRLLTKRARRTMKEVFDGNIGKAIGMGAFEWKTAGIVDDVPINNGYTGVLMTAAQLARFGHLYLNEGHWNGRQLLSRYFIRTATSNQVWAKKTTDSEQHNSEGSGCYGYNWWVNAVLPSGALHLPDAPKSLYYTSDFHGNVCFVVPEWEMVVVCTLGDVKLKKPATVVYNEFFKRMALAIKA